MAIIIGIESTTLSATDRQRLTHPACVGVILFQRNYRDPRQLQALCAHIRHLAPSKLITIDHEGGRVQRLHNGFTTLPGAHTIGRLHRHWPHLAHQLATDIGIIIAHELSQYSIDLSFTPVLDLYDPTSSVIAERAFAADPDVVNQLAGALRRGLHRGGMAAVGKHYPGHGRIHSDSHHTLCRDPRPYPARAADREPFLAQIQDGIEGIMMAHIIYPESHGRSAGFAAPIIAELRHNGFSGTIFSDDLDMAGAQIYPKASAQVRAALAAGVDVSLICNRFSAMEEALRNAPMHPNPDQLHQRLAQLRHTPTCDGDAIYRQARAHLQAYRHLLI